VAVAKRVMAKLLNRNRQKLNTQLFFTPLS
jgi:hypothetical protein